MSSADRLRCLRMPSREPIRMDATTPMRIVWGRTGTRGACRATHRPRRVAGPFRPASAGRPPPDHRPEVLDGVQETARRARIDARSGLGSVRSTSTTTNGVHWDAPDSA
ncbi:MAG: hypothetical protein D6725_09110 [Planctomycetota bacterium]|nr:MAG: hypothetical protein D6725_09110 [Planctomycetota bacterium]